MSSNWGVLEGRQVGLWPLESLLGVRANKAFFLTRDPVSQRALLLEMAIAEGEAAGLLPSWNRARKLADVPLLRVHAADEDYIDQARVVYAVLDLPDDDLGELLTRQKMHPAQARTFFATIAKALDSLHQHGLAHGAVFPSSIFMFGNDIRLSVDTLSPAGEQGREADLQQFGLTLIQAMTGRTNKALADEPELLQAASQLGHPFYDVAVACLRGSPDRQITAAEISEALLSEQPVLPEPPPDLHPVTIPAPDRKTAARHSFASWLGGPQWPIMATGGIVAIVLGIYLLVHGPRPHTPPVTPIPAEQPVTAKKVEPSPEPPPSPVPATRGSAERSTPAPAPAEVKAPSSGRGKWAVIAATYGTFDGAQKLANKIEKHTPSLHPHVFPRAGQGKHYFVVLGSGLTQNEAERLRRDARAQGAPHDTYVTKLDES